MEKLLLYNVKNPQDIIKTASDMRIVCGFINESDVDKTLAELTSGVRGISLSDAAEFHSPDNKESLVIFCDVTDKHMDKILFEMKSRQIAVDYKAVMTETNRAWNIHRLMFEMERERRAYMNK